MSEYPSSMQDVINNALRKASRSRMKLVLVGATRYYLGRHTGAVHDYCDILREIAPVLPAETKAILDHDISDWLAEHPTHVFAGVDDAEPWRKVLDAIRKEPPCDG